ncbi:MAG TPA: hypothetical protein VGD49_08930 [Longimicrobiales bacterium]
MQTFQFKRRVMVEGQEYYVDVRRSEPRHVDRFDTRCYVLVELPRGWRVTLPVPDYITESSHLWYREMIDLVYQAKALVGKRAAVA